MIFKPLLDAKKVQIYFDDIMVATPTVEENLKIIEKFKNLSDQNEPM